MSDRVVVMSMGVVQQIGAPHEIYTQPANKMVADFIGLVNFMEGEAKGDRVFLKGSKVSFPNTSKISGEATIAVRPENITMSLDGGQIEGQLTHRFYLGDAGTFFFWVETDFRDIHLWIIGHHRLVHSIKGQFVDRKSVV